MNIVPDCSKTQNDTYEMVPTYWAMTEIPLNFNSENDINTPKIYLIKQKKMDYSENPQVGQLSYLYLTTLHKSPQN